MNSLIYPILLTILSGIAPAEFSITGETGVYGGYNNHIRDNEGNYHEDGLLEFMPGFYLNGHSRGDDHLLRYFFTYHLYTSREANDEFENALLYTATWTFPPKHRLRFDFNFNQGTPNTLNSRILPNTQIPQMQAEQYYVFALDTELALESRLTPRVIFRPQIAAEYWILDLMPEDLRYTHYNFGVSPLFELGFMVTRRGEFLVDLRYTHRFFLSEIPPTGTSGTSEPSPDYFTLTGTVGYRYEYPPWLVLRLDAGVLAGKILPETDEQTIQYSSWDLTLAASAEVALRIPQAFLEMTLRYSRGIGQIDFVTQGGVFDAASIVISENPLPNDKLIFYAGGTFYRSSDWFADSQSESQEALIGWGVNAGVRWRFWQGNDIGTVLHINYSYFREEMGAEAVDLCEQEGGENCQWLDLHIATAGFAIDFDIYGSRRAIEASRTATNAELERQQAQMYNEPPPPVNPDEDSIRGELGIEPSETSIDVNIEPNSRQGEDGIENDNNQQQEPGFEQEEQQNESEEIESEENESENSEQEASNNEEQNNVQQQPEQ